MRSPLWASMSRKNMNLYVFLVTSSCCVLKAIESEDPSFSDEDLQPIDKINISAFVTNLSENDKVENVSELFTESLDVQKDREFNSSEGPESILMFSPDVEHNPGDYLSLDYLIKVLVTNLDTGIQYTVEDYHIAEEEIGRLVVKDPQRNATSSCIMFDNGYGHATTGVRCRTNRNLPEECFCWDGVCSHSYIPWSRLADKLIKNGEVKSSEENYIWRMNTESLQVNATFSLKSGHYLYPTLVYMSGFGYILGSKRDTQSLRYEIVHYEAAVPSVIRKLMQPEGGNIGDLQPSPGIFCPKSSLHSPHPFPELPNQFSVDIETIDQDVKQVSYSHQQYDLKHKLVSMKFTPQPLSGFSGMVGSLFFSSLAFSQRFGFSTASYNIIHDFNTGLQYTVSDHKGNCSIEPIRAGPASDAAPLDGGRYVRLKLARELLEVSPQNFVYSGQRIFRGILANVWTAEKLGENIEDPYSTVEVFFSHPEYNIVQGQVNNHQHVPLGMMTYQAESRTSAFFSTVTRNHYYQFSNAEPHWDAYDISSCFSPSESLYLKVTIQVGYGQLIQYGVVTAQNAIRTSIAREAKISPLRITNIFLSSSSKSAGVDVWFVAHQGTDIVGNAREGELGKHQQPDLTEALETLEGVFSVHRPQLKLQLGEGRTMQVSVLGGSLEVVRESLHPASKSKSYLLLRATYTAGSMAGLGFSMAVLGLGIGVLVGFLLWKRRLGLPYSINCPERQGSHPFRALPEADMVMNQGAVGVHCSESRQHLLGPQVHEGGYPGPPSIGGYHTLQPEERY